MVNQKVPAMANLVAYIPVINQRYLAWIRGYPDSLIYLITQEEAQELLPRLGRNMVAIPASIATKAIEVLCPISFIDHRESLTLIHGNFILPDEDVCHLFAEKYLDPYNISYGFEMIWARWDMSAVKRMSPVIADEYITFTEFHQDRLNLAKKEARKSPDWWRQVGAALFVNGMCVSVGCNNHYPTEYTTDILGDPRMNYDAGQIGKYSSYHAEKTVIVRCACEGIKTRGGILYVTVFPCEDCARMIVLAGIDHLFFEEGYSALDALEVLKSAGVRITQIIKDPSA